MSYTYELMYLPSQQPDSYVLVTSRGASVAVRHYADPRRAPQPVYDLDLEALRREARRVGAPLLEEDAHKTTDAPYWWARIQRANRGIGVGGVAASPAPTPRRPQPLADAPGDFVDHRGRPLRTLADWERLHPPRHWREGYSAMELAKAWHGAGGVPAAVTSALQGSPLEGLTLVRGIAECRTPVPGAGRPSHTDLMVEARDPRGQAMVLAVEGKVDESFGPRVGDWLRKVEHARSAANKRERLEGLCEGLDLDPDSVAHLRYQLLHRTWSALSHARSAGAGIAALVVHTFATGPDLANRAAYGDFLAAMGGGSAGPGAPVHLGRRLGVDLWAAWVSDP